MSKLSLIDKLGVLINLSTSSMGLVVALVVLLIFGILLAFTNKKNEKYNKIMYVVMTAIIVGLVIATYHSSLGNMFSYMMNNFFIAVYFPTIAIYFAAIIAMNIIVWVSIFSYKSSKQIRALNVSIYVIMNYLMALLLKVINSNKLDIFDQASLYSNKEATALIELSSLVFVVWIIFLIIYKIILIYIKKEYKPKVKRIIVRKKVKKLPENFEPKTIPDYVYGKVPHKETLVINTSEIIDTSVKSEEEILLERFSKQFTLDDYKLFSRLLKEEQERKNNQKVDFIHINQNEKVKGKKVKKEEKKPKKKETNIEFDTVRNYEKIRKKAPKQREFVVTSANVLEEDDYRAKQKQEIIRMEEERRELLRQEQEKQRKIEEQKRKAYEAQQRREQEEKEMIERQKRQLEEERQRKLEQQKKEQHALDILLQKQQEEEREQRKLTELEMLYR